jgi:hypothetical protein
MYDLLTRVRIDGIKAKPSNSCRAFVGQPVIYVQHPQGLRTCALTRGSTYFLSAVYFPQNHDTIRCQPKQPVFWISIGICLAARIGNLSGKFCRYFSETIGELEKRRLTDHVHGDLLECASRIWREHQQGSQALLIPRVYLLISTHR